MEDESLETKKLAIIRILHILEAESDEQHPLTQECILEKLKNDYGIVIERKAVGRNIQLLKGAGYDIETTRKGSYLSSRAFDDSELRVLVDSVLSSRYISERYTKDLIEKISTLSNKYFKSRIKNVYAAKEWSKSENLQFFYTINLVDEAIEKNLKIKFAYNRYQKDKKLHKTTEHIASPYQMILHNQRYFLIAFSEKWQDITYYRLDKITNMEIIDEKITNIRSIKGYENGIDYKIYSSSLPYMFSDKLEIVTFAINDERMIDQIVDWFGVNFKVEKSKDRFLITVKASPSAMEYWALQYLKNIEIISPQSLRERIIKDIQDAAEKYKI